MNPLGSPLAQHSEREPYSPGRVSTRASVPQAIGATLDATDAVSHNFGSVKDGNAGESGLAADYVSNPDLKKT